MILATAKREARELTPREQARLDNLGPIGVLEHRTSFPPPADTVAHWTGADGRRFDVLALALTSLPDDRQLAWARALRELARTLDPTAPDARLDGALNARFARLEKDPDEDDNGTRNARWLKVAAEIRTRRKYGKTHSTARLAREVHEQIKDDWPEATPEAVRKVLRTMNIK